MRGETDVGWSMSLLDEMRDKDLFRHLDVIIVGSRSELRRDEKEKDRRVGNQDKVKRRARCSNTLKSRV